jgi:hypothetical protein
MGPKSRFDCQIGTKIAFLRKFLRLLINQRRQISRSNAVFKTCPRFSNPGAFSACHD